MRAARRLRRLNELSDEVEQSAHPVAAASVFLEPEDVCRVACTCQSWSRVLAAGSKPWQLQLARVSLRAATEVCSDEAAHAGLHDWRGLCASHAAGFRAGYPVRPPRDAASPAPALHQLCTAAEEWVHVATVAKEDQCAKPLIRANVPAARTPLAEIQYWKDRAAMLKTLNAQLADVVEDTADVMESKCPELHAQVKTASSTVKRLFTEATWNTKYFAILEQPFKTLAEGSLRSLSVIIPGMMKTLAMVWTSSKFYNVASRMEPLLFRCCRALVARVSSLLHPVGTMTWACRVFSGAPNKACWDAAAQLPAWTTRGPETDDGSPASQDAVMEVVLLAFTSATELMEKWRTWFLVQCGRRRAAEFADVDGSRAVLHALHSVPLPARGGPSSSSSSSLLPSSPARAASPSMPASPLSSPSASPLSSPSASPSASPSPADGLRGGLRGDFSGGVGAAKKPPLHPRGSRRFSLENLLGLRAGGVAVDGVAAVPPQRAPAPPAISVPALPSSPPSPVAADATVAAATSAAAAGAGAGAGCDPLTRLSGLDRAQLDVMRRGLRTPSFEHADDRPVGSDWGSFDVGVFVGVLDYALQMCADVRQCVVRLSAASAALAIQERAAPAPAPMPLVHARKRWSETLRGVEAAITMGGGGKPVLHRPNLHFFDPARFMWWQGIKLQLQQACDGLEAQCK